MRHSILLSFGPTRPEQLVPFANLVKWAGADRLWQGQGMVLESHHLAAWLAGLGIRVPTGYGVSLMPFRSPYQAAVEARSVAMTTGHPVVAGFGPGSLSIQQGVLGRPYASPLRAAREYLEIVRGLVNGEHVEVEGEYYSVAGNLIKALAPPVSVGLGVLRPGMARLAGEIADVAITWLSSARYLSDTLIPAIRGAQRGPADPATVTAIVPVAVAREGRDVTDLAGAACGSHLQLPHYRATLRTAGIEIDGEWSAEHARKLVDGGVFLYGTVAEIHERLAEYRAAGVDEVVLSTTGTGVLHGPKAAAKDLLEILQGVPAE